MRTIKFRAFDKNKNMMVYDGNTEWMPNAYPVSITHNAIKFYKKLDRDTSIKDENGVVGYTDWEMDSYEWENVEIMQFTGRKDKNGKEIYEGDKIKYWLPTLKEEKIGVVEWNKDWCAFWLKGKDWEELDWVKITNLEVIGNIYEPPTGA